MIPTYEEYQAHEAFKEMELRRNIHRNRLFISRSNIPKKKRKKYEALTTEAYVSFFNANQKWLKHLKPLTVEQREKLQRIIYNERGY